MSQTKAKTVKERAVYKTVSLRPYTMLSTSVHTRLYFMFGVLLVQLLMLFLTKSWDALSVIVCTVLATLLAETSELARKRHRVFNYLHSLCEGIIIGFFIPSSYPLISVFFITLCISLVCRWMLCGYPNNWVNPIALTVAVCWLIGMNQFPLFTLTPVVLQAKNPSALLLENGTFPVLPFDAAFTSFCNQKLFSLFNVSVPEGFISLLWDTQAVIPAFRFNALTLLSSIVFIAFDVLSPLIPAVFLFVYLLLVRFLAPVFYGGIFGQGDMLLALCTSGTLFSTLFLLQWTGTTPQLQFGKICYAVGAGIIAFLVVGCGVSSAGTVFSILVLNVISSMIQAAETLYADHCIQTVQVPKCVALQKEGIHA